MRKKRLEACIFRAFSLFRCQRWDYILNLIIEMVIFRKVFVLLFQRNRHPDRIVIRFSLPGCYYDACYVNFRMSVTSSRFPAK